MTPSCSTCQWSFILSNHKAVGIGKPKYVVLIGLSLGQSHDSIMHSRQFYLGYNIAHANCEICPFLLRIKGSEFMKWHRITLKLSCLWILASCRYMGFWTNHETPSSGWPGLPISALRRVSPNLCHLSTLSTKSLIFTCKVSGEVLFGIHFCPVDDLEET